VNVQGIIRARISDEFVQFAAFRSRSYTHFAAKITRNALSG